ncbi:aldo/keto reductase [Pleurocapsales cyanobacterium LEGE 06147]|nr:aldo/keto reductase [Pleurocapsales cyanobacterium LEGE 06147]
MQYKKFGKTDLEISALGLGAAPIGSRTGPDESKATLNQAFELGINFYDTAPSYGQGSSEEIIGEVFKKKRERVIITTKVGYSPTATLQAAAKLKPLMRSLLHKLPGIRRSIQTFVNSQNKIDFKPSYIRKSVEESLQRLRSDYIDLLLLHSPPREIVERGDVFEQLKSLKSQGKIRYYGVSASDLENSLILLKYPEYEISALQITLNLFEQEAIDKLIPLAKQRGIAIVAREPFAHGKLIPRNADTDTEGLKYVGPLETDEQFAFLVKPGIRTMTQAALQFVLQTEGVSVVLAGMSKVKHVQANVAVFSVPALTNQEMKKIRSSTQVCL